MSKIEVVRGFYVDRIEVDDSIIIAQRHLLDKIGKIQKQVLELEEECRCIKIKDNGEIEVLDRLMNEFNIVNDVLNRTGKSVERYKIASVECLDKAKKFLNKTNNVEDK